MKLGCFLTLLLLPILIVIGIEKKRRRRAALPPEERKILEDEDQYGSIDESITCIYCGQTGCVRTRVDLEDAFYRSITRKESRCMLFSTKETEERLEALKIDTLHVQCMNCGSYWDMYDPHAKEEIKT